ncbi:NC domain-containing-related-like protein [Melia azedarach]|uniref:NC domain-containing-related-like protein n=1 Tax=Melia azedarach TaxID=155640 RepID=A0ACC1WVV2_MELAZ|nr:NC domain-containing-related-like protein [Melia azedarach]
MFNLCRAVAREKLNPGDHICSERFKGLYFHHGIYVGNDMVIHVIGRRNKPGFKSSNSSATNTSKCQNCGYKKGSSEGIIIKTCLDCFLDGHSLYVYNYEDEPIRWFTEQHGGSVKPPSEVVTSAYNELERKDKFGANYHLIGRNCEHFATFCNTGVAFSIQSILWLLP